MVQPLFVVNIGLHGDEYDASLCFYNLLRPFLVNRYPDSSFLLLPQLSEWCVRHRFRFDPELVDLNRLFVPACSDFFYPGLAPFESPYVSPVSSELLAAIDKFIRSSPLHSFSAIESCLASIHHSFLSLPIFFSMAQSTSPGLPGFNLSSNASQYFSRCNAFLDSIVQSFLLHNHSHLVILDLHSGVGSPAELSLGEIYHPAIATPSPLVRQGTYLSYLYHALATLLPVAPLCLSLEIGTFGSYEAMCFLFQELQARRGLCSQPSAFKPSRHWCSQVSLSLDSGLSTHVLPLIAEAFT